MLRTTILAVALAISLSSVARAIDDYVPGPDSQRKEGVPRGKVTKYSFSASKVFPGTTRDYWVYVPAQIDAAKPAAVMVFQDGGSYVNETGQFRTPIVFDNLIHAGQMPVTVGVFINPGVFPDRPGRDGRPGSNRSFEYDTLSDAYARFLLEEMLPEVEKVAGVKLTKDPEMRAIGGMSSGGICAFTVAWERPDEFRKVLSHIGSFTAIAYRPAQNGNPMRPGGDLYPALVRKTPKKPLRVFLQDGENDLDNNHGNWFLANQQMAKALEFAKYDVKAVWGDGKHSGKHGGAILPESLRWLWRTEKPVAEGGTGR